MSSFAFIATSANKIDHHLILVAAMTIQTITMTMVSVDWKISCYSSLAMVYKKTIDAVDENAQNILVLWWNELNDNIINATTHKCTRKVSNSMHNKV